ncbi:MAG TPA: class I SAM-dependent methyltransferase [Balneolaceae bacterium]
MPLFLSQRDAHSSEQMDAPDCDPTELENTYRQFSTINTLISQWRKIYDQWIYPYARKKGKTSILDVGFGGGDIPVKLAEWAAKDELNVDITAIDPDKRAFDFAQKLKHPENVQFLNCSIADLDTGTRKFDFVISNHVLHHLSHKQLTEMLALSKKLSKKAVIFNDGRRSDIAYLLFNIFSRPVFRSSFITQDGLTSIKRSYTYDELVAAVPDEWKVRRLFPFRLLLVYEHE